MESMKKELVEKQELLSQAAKAFELIEEQKEATARDQAQRQQLFEKEQEKVAKLEKGQYEATNLFCTFYVVTVKKFEII